jgi:phage gp36-like protein
MPYATQQDMIDRFGAVELANLTDRERAGAIDAAVLDQALADASAEIDGYIGTREKLPIVNPPRVLVALCCDLARYKLYDQAAPAQVEKRQTNALNFLSAIATGKVSLGLTDSEAKPAPAAGAEIHSDGLVFGRDDHGFL